MDDEMDDDVETEYDRRHRPKVVTNSLLWDEIRYIRSKLDSLEGKVLILAGAIAAISTAIAIYELLVKQ
jgi:hypothetical protein